MVACNVVHHQLLSNTCTNERSYIGSEEKYLGTSEVVEAAVVLAHPSSWLHLGSENGTLHINVERSGSGAESCTFSLPLIELEPRNELSSRKSFPSIVELLLQKPGF